jgi:transposase-like protein
VKRLYGRDWRGAVARRLGVHRATLWRWLAGKRTSRDIDADLVAMVDAERDVAAARSDEIARLQRTLLAFAKRDLA